MPIRVQDSIARQYPSMAYVPGRLPTGFHFQSWTHSKKARYFEYQLIIVKPASNGGTARQLAFQVLRRSCPSAPSWPAQGSIRVRGRAVKWSRTKADSYAWLCMRSSRGQSVVVFGMDGSNRENALLAGYAEPAK